MVTSMSTVRGIVLCLALASVGSAQDPAADSEIRSLGEKLLSEAKAAYEGNKWLDAIELAERARTPFQTLLELFSTQKKADELAPLNERVSQCNQLIRLARDARKAELAKAEASPTKKPELPQPPGKEPPVAAPGEKVPEKLPPPEAAAQEVALKSVRDVFRVDYAKTDPVERVVLAKKLSTEAAATKVDNAARFALYREACDVAATAGDLQTALRAIGDLARTFAVDALALRIAAISKLPSTSTDDLAPATIDGCFQIVDETLRADHFDITAIILKKAELLSRKPTNIALQARVQSKSRDLGEVRKQRQAIGAAVKTLGEKPVDPDANLQVGRFVCFFKGDWEKGLPILAKGSDASLKKLAERDLGKPGTPEAQLEIADGWRVVSEKETSTLAKDNIKNHAKEYFERAVPGLSGFPKTRVAALLEEFEDYEKSRWAVNLLKLIDVKKHPWGDGATTWSFNGRTLVVPAANPSHCLVPYMPPEEYDLRVVAARKAGPDNLSLGMVAGGKNFQLVLGGWGGELVAAQLVDGKWGNANETTTKFKVFPDDKPKTIDVRVRKSSLTVFVDHQKIMDWSGDLKRLGLAGPARFPRALGIASVQTCFHISEMWLTPVSGQGEKWSK